MIFGLRKGAFYSLIGLSAVVLGALGVYTLRALPALAVVHGPSLAAADENQASSKMCTSGENNEMFFVTCGGIY